MDNLNKPCHDCPWIPANAKHGLLDKIEGVKEAGLAGKRFLCHARAGHPTCVGVAVWRKKEKAR